MTDSDREREPFPPARPSFFHLGISGWVAIGSLVVGLVCLKALNDARKQIEDANRRVEQTVRTFEGEREATESVRREIETLLEKFRQLERQTRFEVDRGHSRIEGIDEELTQVRDTVVELVRRERRRLGVNGTTPQPTPSPDDDDPPPPPETQPDPTRVYTVVDGDNLYRISRKLGVTVKELLDVNPTINPGRLSIGQELRIPIVP